MDTKSDGSVGVPYQLTLEMNRYLAGIPFAMLLGGYLEKRIGARKSAFLGSALYT